MQKRRNQTKNVDRKKKVLTIKKKKKEGIIKKLFLENEFVDK
jgi:hypothetical protein